MTAASVGPCLAVACEAHVNTCFNCTVVIHGLMFCVSSFCGASVYNYVNRFVSNENEIFLRLFPRYIHFIIVFGDFKMRRLLCYIKYFNGRGALIIVHGSSRLSHAGNTGL